MTLKILRFVIWLLFRLLTRIEINGLENVPTDGPCLVCANHLSMLDPPLIFIFLKRKDVTGLATTKHRKNWFTRWIINTAGGIWLNREEIDVRALRAAVDHLQHGGVLGIAPEGTRSKVGALIPAKTGVAYLADKAEVPVIPVAITGTEKTWAELKRLHRPLLTITVGPPFSLPPIDRREREEALRRNTDEIMCRIAAMLPPSYRGAYADHPRLKELIAPLTKESIRG